ncbi:MAG TPA: serine hydrolase domain-containing protein [Gammaproteobacteria bacterium]|nr:serine hydrolase domain-containing protein [Gammaproteobacteria bacterium]
MHSLKLKTSASFLLLTLFLSAPGYAGEPDKSALKKAGIAAEHIQRLEQVFQGYVDDRQMAGSVIMLSRRGQVVYQKAFGMQDREAGIPMQVDTIFRIASQTKALVSLGAMILQEEGRLLLSDPVGKYIPEFMQTTVAEPRNGGGYKIVQARRPITIHDLMTHTSGVSYGRGTAADLWARAGIQDWYFADRQEPIADTVRRMAALPFDAQPGERWIYGYSIDILGVVIEKASGQSLDALLRERIFNPLGMKDTYFYLPQDKANRLAAVYTPLEKVLARAPAAGMDGQGAYVDGPRKSFSGGAGLLSTAPDYMRFLQMMLNNGELDGKRIISRKSVELMTVDHLITSEFQPGNGFGLGFAVTKNPGARGVVGTVGEYGWGGAYHSTYWADPKEQLAVVYFTQLRPDTPLKDHDTLRALVYGALND